jgi:hypothetical protein
VETDGIVLPIDTLVLMHDAVEVTMRGDHVAIDQPGANGVSALDRVPFSGQFTASAAVQAVEDVGTGALTCARVGADTPASKASPAPPAISQPMRFLS